MSRTAGLLATLVALLCASCADGRDLSFDDAKLWIKENEAGLVAITDVLATCSDDDVAETNRIFVDGTAFTDHCKQHQSKLVGMMDRLDLANLTYPTKRNEDGQVAWVNFGIYSSGIATSGTSLSAKYHRLAQPCQSVLNEDGQFHYSRRPMTDAPCHWFYERMKD